MPPMCHVASHEHQSVHADTEPQQELELFELLVLDVRFSFALAQAQIAFAKARHHRRRPKRPPEQPRSSQRLSLSLSRPSVEGMPGERRDEEEGERRGLVLRAEEGDASGLAIATVRTNASTRRWWEFGGCRKYKL